MGALRKIEIAIDEDIAAKADQAVASGEFATLEDVIAEALAAWQIGRIQSDPANSLRLRQLWDEGLASGPAISGNFDLNDIKRRAAERADTIGRPT